jgi:hypothetical protein
MSFIFQFLLTSLKIHTKFVKNKTQVFGSQQLFYNFTATQTRLSAFSQLTSAFSQFKTQPNTPLVSSLPPHSTIFLVLGGTRCSHLSSYSTSITSGSEVLELLAPPEDILFGCHTIFRQFMHRMTWLR